MAPSELGAYIGPAHLRSYKGRWSSLSTQLWEMSKAKAKKSGDVRDGDRVGTWPHALIHSIHPISLPSTPISHPTLYPVSKFR